MWRAGGGNRIPARSVHDHDAVPCRGLDVDVVHPDPGAADGPEGPSRGFDDSRGDLDARANDDAFVVRGALDELLFAEPQLDVDLEAFGFLEQGDSLVGDRVGDEYFSVRHEMVGGSFPDAGR